MKAIRFVVLAALLGGATLTGSRAPAQAPAAAADDDAARFGAQELAYSMSLSADGQKLVFVGPVRDSAGTIAVTVDLNTGKLQAAARADGKPLNLTSCDWSAADRLVCTMYGITSLGSMHVPVTRLLAVDADGGKPLMLGQKDATGQVGLHQFDGRVVDWLDGVDGQVLMARYHLPQQASKLTGSRYSGLGVERINTRNGTATMVERPDDDVTAYVSDGLGTIRLKTVAAKYSEGDLKGVDQHYFRQAGDREWRLLGIERANSDEADNITPLAVDPTVNAAYVLRKLDGRQALYRVTLDASMKQELVFAAKDVDVDGVVRVGRGGRVIGASYVTDRRQAVYFDDAYRAIAKALAAALPSLPLISFVSASADERVLLVRAGSDMDAGHFYLYNRLTTKLTEVLQARSALNGLKLSPVRAVTYKAADGTDIPAYLTLPPGVTEAHGLPAIVMPHGGPEARDEWGFDWLAQFFAHEGFVVLQPNFRGSAGYGDAWFKENGFKGWKQSIGDICDGGRWLVAQGMAAAGKLAIFGWSYGGYAALQANAIDPALFKAVVAVAPVTDLGLLKTQAQYFTSGNIVGDFVGSGPHVEEGSPDKQAGLFQAPVLLFHGDQDINVDVMQSRRMDSALQDAGKRSQLIVYPGLDHGLRDGSARADMLRKSLAFLRENLKL
jgi:dipeptidyl aminopeptidase/acylaminoacyl peptidase